MPKISAPLHIFFFFIILLSSASNALAITKISGTDLYTGTNLEVKAGSKGLVAVFLSARCPCSNSHIPILKKLSEEYKEFSFVAIHSNSDESLTETKDYFVKNTLPFPILQDSDHKIANELKALKTPHAFVFSSDGSLLYKGGVTNSNNAAASDKNYLLSALNDIRDGNKVKTPEGRTLGCIISRKK